MPKIVCEFGPRSPTSVLPYLKARHSSDALSETPNGSKSDENPAKSPSTAKTKKRRKTDPDEEDNDEGDVMSDRQRNPSLAASESSLPSFLVFY